MFYLFSLLEKSQQNQNKVLILWGKSEISEDQLLNLPNGSNIKLLDLSHEFGKDKSMSDPASWLEQIIKKHQEYIFQ